MSNGAGNTTDPMGNQPSPNLDLATIRRSYGASTLTEDSIEPTWAGQLLAWYAAAAAHPEVAEPNAMQVATVDPDGRPDVRTVLARGIDERGVVFFTNYDSAKGVALAAHPVAAATLVWLPLERQVRLRGPVTKVDPQETYAYFTSRPRGARLAAWTSRQSAVLADRAELEHAYQEIERRFDGVEDIPVPPNWGGYRIGVEEIEFWQGREFRLHDRLRYRKLGEPAGGWVVERLAP